MGRDGARRRTSFSTAPTIVIDVPASAQPMSVIVKTEPSSGGAMSSRLFRMRGVAPSMTCLAPIVARE